MISLDVSLRKLTKLSAKTVGDRVRYLLKIPFDCLVAISFMISGVNS